MQLRKEQIDVQVKCSLVKVKYIPPLRWGPRDRGWSHFLWTLSLAVIGLKRGSRGFVIIRL